MNNNDKPWGKLAILAGTLLITIIIGIVLAKTSSVNATPVAGSDNVPSYPRQTGDTLSCLSCHQQELNYHDKLGPGNLACWSCHTSTDITMSTLQLANGTHVGLKESTELCGQCHQNRYTAWQEGTHGIPGTIAAIPCAGCHNPHRPQVALLDINIPPPPPLDTELPLPTDALLITGISVFVLLGLAVLFARRQEAL